MNRRVIPILLAFLCMGFVDGVGVFVGLAQDRFALSNFVAQLVSLAGFIGFGLLSVPMGLVQDRTSKKTILLIGLVVALIGAGISAFGLTVYGPFLATVFFLGAGAAILQVAGNPIMRDVSGPEKYPRNLSVGQSIKAIGSLSGAFVAVLTTAGIWRGTRWEVLFPIYAAILAVTVIWVALTKIEDRRDEGIASASLASCLALLRNPFILMTVLGIFVYVGTEVCLSSGVNIYMKSDAMRNSSVIDWLKEQFGFVVSKKTMGLLSTALFGLLILVGRSLGAVVLNWISAPKLLVATVLVAIAGLLGLVLVHHQAAVVASVVLAGLGCANIFPLIFSITVNRMPERSNEISGLMVTAIVGGALLPPLMGLLADATSVSTGFLVPLACAVYLLIVGLACLRKPATRATA